MGTYTDYSLTVEFEEGKYTANDIIAHLRRECEEARYALGEDGDTANEAKWYQFNEDMIEFSKKYPDVVFVFNLVMEGDGSSEYEDDDGNIECDFSFQNGVEL